jgi:hypothetical protein
MSRHVTVADQEVLSRASRGAISFLQLTSPSSGSYTHRGVERVLFTTFCGHYLIIKQRPPRRMASAYTLSRQFPALASVGRSGSDIVSGWICPYCPPEHSCTLNLHHPAPRSRARMFYRTHATMPRRAPAMTAQTVPHAK